MQYRVTGCQRETGDDIAVVLEAATAAAAQLRGNELGIMVETVALDTASTAAQPSSNRLPTAVQSPPSVGCPRCGNSNLHQRKHTTGLGWALLVLAILSAITIVGIPLAIIFFILACGCSERRGHCQACGWQWRC